MFITKLKNKDKKEAELFENKSVETLKMINDSKSFLFDIDFMDEAIKDLEDSGK